MKIISFIIVAAIMVLLARKKGFNPWLWIFAAGLPGLIILACMPSANVKGLDAAVLKKRRRTGNALGSIITGITAIIAIIVAFMLTR